MDTITKNYRNSIDNINLKNNLDNLTINDSISKLVEVYNLLSLDGILEIHGLDLREVSRCYLLDHITNQEYYNLFNGYSQPTSMCERIEQLKEIGFTIQESRLTGLIYYIKAKR